MWYGDSEKTASGLVILNPPHASVSGRQADQWNSRERTTGSANLLESAETFARSCDEQAAEMLLCGLKGAGGSFAPNTAHIPSGPTHTSGISPLARLISSAIRQPAKIIQQFLLTTTAADVYLGHEIERTKVKTVRGNLRRCGAAILFHSRRHASVDVAQETAG